MERETVMPMTVIMTFKGDVICYQKRGEWKFVFPTDPLHDLKYSIDGSRPIALRIKDTNRTISINPATKLYPDVDPNDKFPDLLNMSGDEMHGTTNGKSNLTEYIDLKEDHELIFMSVKGGAPGDSVRTMKNYWVDDQNNTLPEMDLKTKVAQEVSLEVILKDGNGISLEIDGK